MLDRNRRRSDIAVKTVEFQTVKIGRSLASKKGNPPSERAEFARKFVEESISRSAALFPKRVPVKAR
jgi:hypothetical protein